LGAPGPVYGLGALRTYGVRVASRAAKNSAIGIAWAAVRRRGSSDRVETGGQQTEVCSCQEQAGSGRITRVSGQPGPGSVQPDVGSRQNEVGSMSPCAVSQQNEGCSDRNGVCSVRTGGCERAESPPPLFVQRILVGVTGLIAFWYTPALERWIPRKEIVTACRRIVPLCPRVMRPRRATRAAPFANRAPLATNADRPPPNAVRLPALSALVRENPDASPAFGGGTGACSIRCRR
jgi:hypothetical protein